MSIKDLPLDTRHRKKPLTLDPAGPNEAQLLALPLRTSAWPEGVLQMSDKLPLPHAPGAQKRPKARGSLERP
jgi:hypothetical protein